MPMLPLIRFFDYLPRTLLRKSGAEARYIKTVRGAIRYAYMLLLYTYY